MKILGKDDVPINNVALTEVLENHISKVLVRFYSIYVYIFFSLVKRRVKKVANCLVLFVVDTTLLN